MIAKNPYGAATQAYQQAGQTALNPVEIVVALYDGILRNIEEAKNAYIDKNLEKMCHTNEKTFRIITALQCHLDFEKGGDTAPALNKFYNIIFSRLAKILESKDPCQEYEYIQSNVRDIYIKWSKLARKVREQGKNL